MRLPLLCASSLLIVACTSGTATSPASSSPAATSAASTVSAPASAPATASAVPATTESAVVASAPPTVSASAEEPVPDVELKNIGMHIGGGPTDEAGMRRTKGPIKKSVEPHFDAFKRCFAKVDDPKKGGDVSVDLKVDAKGGKAELKKYKSALKGEGFEACVRAVFDAIDFEKPADGTTMVSYSLRFTPKKG